MAVADVGKRLDLDPAGNAIVVRSGKGGKRRIVGIDEWGWHELGLARGRTLPVGALICVLQGATAGWAVSESCVRRERHRLGSDAGVRRRIAPHH